MSLGLTAGSSSARDFAWFDATVHRFLRDRGTDQGKLRSWFGSLGSGLTEASRKSHAPARPDDGRARAIEWGDKTFALAYIGRVGSTTVVHRREVGGLFVEGDRNRLRLHPPEDLRRMIEDD